MKFRNGPERASGDSGLPRTMSNSREAVDELCNGRCNVKGEIGGRNKHKSGWSNALRCRVFEGRYGRPVVFSGTDLCPRMQDANDRRRRRIRGF